MTDVTRILEHDHRAVEHLFAQIKDKKGNDRAKLVEQLASDLRTHMSVEEKIVYPFILKHVSGTKEMVEEAKNEHDGARTVLEEVERLLPDEPGLDGAIEMLEAGVSHHVDEEETDVFPKVRTSASKEELNEVGARVDEAKAKAALDAMTRDELMERAQKLEIAGRSTMTKDELINALWQ